MFLTSQFQLKLGLFDESKINSNKALELLEENKEEFKDDYGILAVKYYLQAANICFIMSDFEQAKNFAQKGLEIIGVTKVTPETKQPMVNSKRDLLNVKIRSSNKLDSTMDPWQLRIEEAQSNNMDLTLMPKEEE